MSHLTQRSCIALKTSWDKDHSVDSLSTLDSLSALIFLDPGIWVALSQMLCFRHQSHIMVAISLHGIELIPRIAFRYATVVVLSDSTRMCFSLRAPQSDFRPSRTVFSSRKFMWYLCSSRLQNPPVEVSPQTAPQPTFEASVVKVRSGLPWLRGLDAVRTLFTHHVNSVLD